MSFFEAVEAITFAVTECQWKIVIQQLVLFRLMYICAVSDKDMVISRLLNELVKWI